MTQHEEHLRDSAPCSSRWDGFCRGDIGNDEPEQGQRVIGRVTSVYGYRVTVTECWNVNASVLTSIFDVAIDGKYVYCTDDRAKAIAVAREWLSPGCYEIPNTFTPDLSLEEQIAEGICDWRAEVEDDSVFGGFRVAFGRTREEAIKNLLA